MSTPARGPGCSPAQGSVPPPPDPCWLIENEDPRDDGTQVVGLLRSCMLVEQALMQQYLYMLASLPPIARDTPLSQSIATREIARRLHQLCIEEMGHLASACNLLVMFGGAPHFPDDVLRVASKAAAGSALRYRLEPLSLSAIERSLCYERRDPDLLMPLLTDLRPLDESGAWPEEKVGRLYRRVYYVACSRNKPGAGIPTANHGWSWFYLGSRSRVMVRPEPTDRESPTPLCTYREVQNALYYIMTDGEGGVHRGEAEHAHVRILEEIAHQLHQAQLPIQPIGPGGRQDDGLSELAVFLTNASSRAYEIVVASLYVLWRADLAIATRQSFFGRLAGFMSVVMSEISSLSSLTPRFPGSDRMLGPSFTSMQPVIAPDSTSEALLQVMDRIDLLMTDLADPPTADGDDRANVPDYGPRLGRLRGVIPVYRKHVQVLVDGVEARCGG